MHYSNRLTNLYILCFYINLIKFIQENEDNYTFINTNHFNFYGTTEYVRKLGKTAMNEYTMFSLTILSNSMKPTATFPGKGYA